jgi:uncharacterized membrane protein
VSTNPATVPETTPDERTMAILAHALPIVTGFIAPLVIFFVKRESKFVAFHAVQAVLLQAFNLAVIFLLMALWVSAIFGAIVASGPKHAAPPTAIFLVFPIVILGFTTEWVFMLIMAIVYAIKAGRGEWAGYPVIGGWARRILKI